MTDMSDIEVKLAEARATIRLREHRNEDLTRLSAGYLYRAERAETALRSLRDKLAFMFADEVGDAGSPGGEMIAEIDAALADAPAATATGETS